MQIYLVGGAVRDKVLNRKAHDKDYVVFGATVNDMLQAGFQQVGKQFPVFLHPQTKNEYALARKEEKIGKNHTDFKFVFGPDITPKEDVLRRDFTCNALLYDEQNEQLIDLVGGVNDIKHKILRHVSDEHFTEDPLRVLRMCRFAAKLDFNIAPQTMDLAKKMVAAGMLEYLSVERIWQEFEQSMLSPFFHKFIIFMRECGALSVILPEVEKLWQIPERTDFHPEGNSGEHTMLVLQQGKNFSPMLKYALLLHDIGKTKTPPELWPHHRGHDKTAREIILAISHRLKVPNNYKEFALLVAEQHMKLRSVPEMKSSTLVEFIGKISGFKNRKKLLNFIRACRCDMFGRAKQVDSEQYNEYALAAQRLLKNYRIQCKICAEDMPNFVSLPKNEHFLTLYNEFRARQII